MPSLGLALAPVGVIKAVCLAWWQAAGLGHWYWQQYRKDAAAKWSSVERDDWARYEREQCASAGFSIQAGQGLVFSFHSPHINAYHNYSLCVLSTKTPTSVPRVEKAYPPSFLALQGMALDAGLLAGDERVDVGEVRAIVLGFASHGRAAMYAPCGLQLLIVAPRVCGCTGPVREHDYHGADGVRQHKRPGGEARRCSQPHCNC